MTRTRAAVELALSRIADPAGEGARTFISVAADRARAEADAQDILAAAGVPMGPLAGLVLSVKDLCDVTGEVTKAGSVVLVGSAPAAADCPAVARLRAAGAIAIGRTNMTEFAYSGVGHNPHYGTPAAPWDRAVTPRVPGGSSSGAAISVTDGMADIGLGSDTGGSVRLPAAVTGLVGFKPTSARVPTDGTVPLSTTLDSLGPLTRSVALAARVDAVLAGEAPSPLPERPVRGLRFYVPTSHVLDDLDPTVAAEFQRALSRLSAAGAVLTEGPFLGLEARMASANGGGFVSAEAWAWHRALLAQKGDVYDPRVRQRILLGSTLGAADYLTCLAARRAYQQAWQPVLAWADAILMPTVPILPPSIASIASDDDEFARINGLLLRNTSTINVLDGCGLALPLTPMGDAPVSLTIAGGPYADRNILAIGLAVEGLLSPT